MAASPLNKPIEDKEKLRKLVEEQAAKFGIDPAVARAMLKVESGDGQNNLSSAGAIGPLQIMPGTARDMGFTGRDEELFNPDVSVPLAMKYYSQLRSRFGNDRDALAAYNAGPGNMGAGRGYAETVLGGLGTAPDMSNMMTMGSTFAGIPQLNSLMGWIQAGLPQGADWESEIMNATGQQRQAGLIADAALQGMDPRSIEEEFRATQPPASGDFLNRLFSNLATGLTGNPMFAQDAASGIANRDAQRRGEILRKNIMSYERAAAEYEKAGNYSQAVKMRQKEYQERDRAQKEAEKLALAEQGLKNFGQLQEVFARHGIMLDGNGNIKTVVPASANPRALLARDKWLPQMVELQKALQGLVAMPRSSNVDKQRYNEATQNLRNGIIGLAATPQEGMTAEELQAQIQQYAGSYLSEADQQALFVRSIRANSDIPGAKVYLDAIEDADLRQKALQRQVDRAGGDLRLHTAPVRYESTARAEPSPGPVTVGGQQIPGIKSTTGAAETSEIMGVGMLKAAGGMLSTLGSMEPADVNMVMPVLAAKMQAAMIQEVVKMAEAHKKEKERKAEQERKAKASQ